MPLRALHLPSVRPIQLLYAHMPLDLHMHDAPVRGT